MKGHGFRTLVLCALIAGSAAVRAEDEPDATSETTDAYIALVQADGARDRQDWKGAVSGYRDALSRYQRIAKSRPDWQPDVVQYRITYCENQIDSAIRAAGRLEDKWASASNSAAPAQDVVAETPEPENGSAYRDRYFALVQENQYIRQRLAEMETQVQQAEASAADTNELAQLRAENEELKQQMVAANGGTNDDESGAAEGAPAGEDVAAKLQALVDENETLRARLEDFQTKNFEDQIEGMKGQLQTLQEEKKALIRDNRQLKAAVEKAKAGRPEDEMAALMQAGLAQERDHSLAAALSLYERASAMKPSNETAILARCRCLLNLGRVNEAVELLQNLIAAGRGGVEARFLLGSGFCAAGVYDKAAGILQSVVRDEPDSAAAHNALGAAWMGVGRLDDACAELERALALDGGLADAHYNLAQVLARGTAIDIEQSNVHYARAKDLGVAP